MNSLARTYSWRGACLFRVLQEALQNAARHSGSQEFHVSITAYLDQRILRYKTRDAWKVRQINAQIAQLRTEMWSAVAKPGAEQLSPVTALTVAGMNDILNSQGYTQAAWWNRIPVAAWILMIAISIFCNFLVGYGAHGKRAFLLLILPVALSISLFLIADIDSPRGGFIRVQPQNLESLAESLHSLKP